MKQLTKKQKIYVIKEMIRYYESKPSCVRGMCYLVRNILEQDIGIEYLSLSASFSEIGENKPTGKSNFEYWFHRGDHYSRLIFCKKILKILEK